MANLIFPTGTSDHGEGILLEVQLAGCTQLLLCMYVYQPDIFLLMKRICVT